MVPKVGRFLNTANKLQEQKYIDRKQIAKLWNERSKG
jgi:hypothetical protein